MAKEMRLIDANKLKAEFEWLKSVTNESSKDEVQEVIQRIDNAPTVDAAPVTRCKDCDHRWNFNGALYCNHERGPAGIVEPDHYCSYGERKE